MLQDGVYGLLCRSVEDASAESARGLAVLRDGRILGSDRWGGVFAGTYAYDHGEGRARIALEVDVPPGGELVTGYAPGASGARLGIAAELVPSDSILRTTVEVAGGALEIELAYLGPVPD